MKKKTKPKNFFDYPVEEQKKIIEAAARDSNKMQREKIKSWSRSKQKGSWSTRAVYE